MAPNLVQLRLIHAFESTALLPLFTNLEELSITSANSSLADPHGYFRTFWRMRKLSLMFCSELVQARDFFFLSLSFNHCNFILFSRLLAFI